MAIKNTELQAKLDDMQAQLDYLFSLHGAARWKHVLKQRADNAKAQGTRTPSIHNPHFGK